MLNSVTYPNKFIITDSSKSVLKPNKFHEYTLDCDHEIYLTGGLMLSEIFSNWINQEKIVADKVNQDLTEYGWINYLTTLSLDMFCSDVGIRTFKLIVEKDYGVNSLPRFVECNTYAKMMLNPQAYDALKGRMIYSVTTANKEYVKTKDFFKQTKNGQTILSLECSKLYELLDEYPWVWLIVAYQMKPFLSVVEKLISTE